MFRGIVGVLKGAFHGAGRVSMNNYCCSNRPPGAVERLRKWASFPTFSLFHFFGFFFFVGSVLSPPNRVLVWGNIISDMFGYAQFTVLDAI